MECGKMDELEVGVPFTMDDIGCAYRAICIILPGR